MRASFLAGIGAWVVGSVATACTVSTSPAPDSTPADFCTDWGKAICQVGNGPCQFDPTECEAFQTAYCTDTFLPSLAAGTRQYNQSNGQACINQLNAVYGSGNASIGADELFTVSTLCSKVIVGNQGSDDPCTADADCTGSLICSSPPNGSGGAVCASPNAKDAGDICADPGDQCQGDTYCASQGGGYPKCVPTAATGGSCSATVPCGSADHCVGGTCMPRGMLGDSCQTNDDCGSSAPFCDTYPPAQCTTGLTFARGSDDCKGILGTNEPADGGGSGQPTSEGGADAPSGG